MYVGMYDLHTWLHTYSVCMHSFITPSLGSMFAKLQVQKKINIQHTQNDNLKLPSSFTSET